MTIRNWPLADRPREKLLNIGAKHLSDAELLAIFLHTGTRHKTALDIARDLIMEFRSLKKLLNANATEICQIKGVGKAKYALLKAALELGFRYQEESIQAGEPLNNSNAVKHFLACRLKDYPYEVFACLFLDNHHHLICFEELFHGTINESSVYPREVIRRGLAHNAAKVILAHNHPSGNPTPSQADCEMTLMLKDTLALVDIQMVDHIVIGHHKCISLAEAGFI